jgi:hypothetical protein
MSLHKKVSQVTFFQLMVQNSLSWDCDRFEILKHVNNEVSIDLVVPVEEAVLVWIVHVGHLECSPEFLHEWGEQEVLVHCLLHLCRELIKDLDVIIFSESLVCVIFPLELKKVLNLLFVRKFIFLVSIEMLEYPKEFIEFITLIKLFVITFELVKDLNKVAHDIRKDGNSKE